MVIKKYTYYKETDMIANEANQARWLTLRILDLNYMYIILLKIIFIYELNRKK